MSIERCPHAGDLTLGDWQCRRETGHEGPCAAVPVFPERPLVTIVERCGATWDFYVTDHTLTTYHVTCTLERGHDLDHRGEIGWPS